MPKVRQGSAHQLTMTAADAALRRLADHRTSPTAALAAGATTYQVAAVLGLHPRTVSRRYGAGGRTPGHPDRGDITDQEILVLHDLGLSQAGIARELSRTTGTPVSRSLVRYRLARHGRAAPRTR